MLHLYLDESGDLGFDFANNNEVVFRMFNLPDMSDERFFKPDFPSAIPQFNE